MDKNTTIEIAQVANGFIIRMSSGGWFNDDRNSQSWAAAKASIYVFQSYVELVCFLDAHFTHRQMMVNSDASSGRFEVAQL